MQFLRQPLFLGFILVFALSSLLMGLLFHAPFRELFADSFLYQERNILAKTEADLTGKGLMVTILKIQSGRTLSLEVFKNNPENESHQFLKRLILDDSRDGYFNFRGNATNLVVTDVDVDGSLEIIAPTFDDNLIPRLHIFKFNSDAQEFEKLGAESFEL